MAKRRHGMRGLAGLGNLRTAGSLGRDVMPGTLGLLLTGGVTLALRAFVRATEMPGLYRWAPAIGTGAGILGAVGVGMLGGTGPALSSITSSVLGGAILMGSEMLNTSRPGAAIALAGDGDMPALPAGEAEAVAMEGLRALAAERLGAIVMQPVDGMRGAYGESVNLQGTINPGAFGQQSFQG